MIKYPAEPTETEMSPATSPRMPVTTKVPVPIAKVPEAKTRMRKFTTRWTAQLWGAAQVLHELRGIPRDTDWLAEADVRIPAVRSGLRAEAWEEEWRKGRVMMLDEAVSYALEEEAGT